MTMVELVVAMTGSFIVLLAVGVLVIGGQRGWHETYGSAHKPIKRDMDVAAIKFGITGRKSNRLCYKVWDSKGGIEAVADANNVASGNSVEFGYWDSTPDPNYRADEYAEFYLDAGGVLKVEYGTYNWSSPDADDPGRIPSRTEILARNVSARSPAGAFSHDVDGNGNGQGCVRMNLRLTDPNDGELATLITAVVLRTDWPR